MAHANISGLPQADWAGEVKTSRADALRVEPRPGPSRARTLPATLIALFLFSQLFDYHALHLSTVTPDKFFFFLIVVLFANAALTHRLRSIPWSGTELSMALFAILCTVSYLITNPDAAGLHYKWLTTLLNLIVFPFGLYLFAKRTRYNTAKTLCCFGQLSASGCTSLLPRALNISGLRHSSSPSTSPIPTLAFNSDVLEGRWSVRTRWAGSPRLHEYS